MTLQIAVPMGQARLARPNARRARTNTAFIIGAVSLPVFVFWRLG